MKSWLPGWEDKAMVSDKSRPEGSRSVGGANGADKRTERRLQIGVGRSMAHHGELLQGVFESHDGSLHRGLITLPLAAQQSTVTFWPREESGIRTRPANRRKAARAAVLTLEYLGFPRSEEHTSELQSLMRISYAVFCLKKKNN